ncbi:ArgE/DapE family deacylase [Nonomuraea gerenzanensis]|uniref:Acetylornithine deacetylase n=1 Tax=Nonomuraea gerenzanensis TaxID=93944 RepID=A0A1M4E695_9ACTN|nr:ArgE/DapE family deacylase [Nonomuraea gerenzanensis]UBU16473.1 ArgE/DapE family deacylase [Nonomuraea gerenzanensis]SBO94294.1 Acetylornithine deacetylase [Nonomuraea gerenzanensis]
MQEAETRVLDAIDEAETVNLLAETVRVPSVTGTDAESDLQHRMARLLTEAGMDVDVWKLDLAGLTTRPGFPGTEAPRVEGYGVVAVTPGGEGPPALALQGHVDVVPTGDLAKWAGSDPFAARISGDVLHGRGACDMKAGLVANLAVARAIKKSGIRLARPLAVHCVISEEDGGLGAFATLARGHTAEAAVISEPTSGAVITANAGALTFRLEIAGRAAHGATRYEGVNAIEAFWPVFQAIRRLEAERNRDVPELFAGNTMPYPIEVGTVRAGDWASTVPDLLIAEGRLGVRLEEDPAAARAAFEEAMAEVDDPWLRANPPVVTWPGGQFASGRLPAGHELLDQVGRAVEDTTGARPAQTAAPYGSDLRLYAAGGIPTLHYGPGDVRFAHAPREQVALRELREVTRALALLAVRRCAAL